MQETLHKSWKEKVIKKTMDKFDPLKLKTCLWQKIINKAKLLWDGFFLHVYVNKYVFMYKDIHKYKHIQ